MGGWILTVFPDVEAEGGLQLTDFVTDTDVQTVVAGRGEGVVQFQHVVIQHGQRAALRHVRHAVGEKTPANPYGRTKVTHTHT